MSSDDHLPPPGEDVFSEDDLAPRDDERRGARLDALDKGATIVAVSALGLWVGGLVALGACAAPMVFEMTPYPFSGRAMGAAFSRFDSIAIGCSVLVLGCEIVRTLLALKRRPRSGAILPRLRRYGAIVMAAGAVYTGMRLSPEIMQLHEAGVRRNVGVEGEQLEAIHAQAELIGKTLIPLALIVIALHIMTLGARREDDGT
jgi:hypothetical protein